MLFIEVIKLLDILFLKKNIFMVYQEYLFVIISG